MWSDLAIIGVFAVFIVALLIGMAKYVKLYGWRRSDKLCPSCSGLLEGDPWRYRGVIVWTCLDCGKVFETTR